MPFLDLAGLSEEEIDWRKKDEACKAPWQWWIREEEAEGRRERVAKWQEIPEERPPALYNGMRHSSNGLDAVTRAPRPLRGIHCESYGQENLGMGLASSLF